MTTVGTDIIDVRRITEKIDALTARVLLPAEHGYCFSQAHPAQHVAGRFAAKEAVFKAMRAPAGNGFSWLDIEILNDESGAPAVMLHGRARAFAQSSGIVRIDISLSHVEEYAVAVALCERAGAGDSLNP
ncbi:holo-ACP synthase [bacterium]|nr:holo-ACP synthase [bacterium]